MPKPKMLFVDDDPKRMLMAIRLQDKYSVTLASTVKMALGYLSRENFDLLDLDHDLGGTKFQDPNNPESGMALVRYIADFGWPKRTIKPLVCIHSFNTFAGSAMKEAFETMGFGCWECMLEYPKYKTGMIAGTFDVIHPGYVRLFRDARTICEHLIIALHEDPSIERPQKMKPILSVEERTEILLGMKYVDDVMPYKTEKELLSLYERADIRIVGDDHVVGNTHFPYFITYHHKRDHNWSATRFKEMIRDSFKEPK